MDAKANSDNEGTKTDMLLEQDLDTLKDEEHQYDDAQENDSPTKQATKSNVNLVDSKGVLYTMQDSQAAISQSKGKKSSRQGFHNSKGSLTIKPPMNKTPSKKSKTPLGQGSSSAQMIPKMENQDLKELDTLDEVNSHEKIKISNIKRGLEKIDTDSQNQIHVNNLSETLTPRALNSSVDNSAMKNVNRNTDAVNQQISIFDGSYNQQPHGDHKIVIEQSVSEDRVKSQRIEVYDEHGSESPIRIRKQPARELESASISQPKASTINFNQSVSDIGASTKIAQEQVQQSGRDSSQLRNYTPLKNQELLGQEFRTPHEGERGNDFDSNIQTDVKYHNQSNINQQRSSNRNMNSMNSPMSLQPHGIQSMQVNITKKDSLEPNALGTTDRTNLFSSIDSQGNTGPENIEITNEGLSGWQQFRGPGPNIRQQHFKGKFFKRISKEKKDEMRQKDLAMQEAKYSINGVQGNIMKLHALPSLSNAIAQQKIIQKHSKSNKHRRKQSMADTQRLSDDGSIQTRRNTAQMKNQDINMMTATFHGGMTMNLEKTLYFNNRDRSNNDQSSFEGNDTRTEMKLTTDMKVSSLLQNKKLEDLIIDENQLNSNVPSMTAQITPNMGVSQTPIEFSKAIGSSPMPPQSPTVLKVNQIPSEGSDAINSIKVQHLQLQMSSGKDLGPVNQPQNMVFARNAEAIDKERAANNETPNISNPNLNIGPRYNDLSQSHLKQGSEDNLNPGTIYQYDGYDSQSLEQIQMDPMAQLSQLNQMYSQQPQLQEYFNQPGVNILPDHQYPHQVHSAMRAKNLNLHKKKISIPKPFGANIDPETSRAQLQLLEQQWREETQRAEKPTSVQKPNQEFSQSMIRFKQSILNSQIKMNADPTRWMPTGSLVHDTQKQSENKHLAPPSFRIEKVKNNMRNSSVEKGAKQGKKQKDIQNPLMPTCQAAKITHLGHLHKNPTSFIGSFIAGGTTDSNAHMTNSPHIITQVGQHNMISVFSSIHEISGMKETSATLKKAKKEAAKPKGIQSIQTTDQNYLIEQSRVGSHLREGESDLDKLKAQALQGGNPQNTQTGTTIHFGNEHVFQSKSSADEGAFNIETNLGTNQAATKTELLDGLKDAGIHIDSSGIVSTASPQGTNRQYQNASWAGAKNHSTMRNQLDGKPISEAAGEETYSKPQSAMGKETVVIRAKFIKEPPKGQVLQPILQPIMGGRGSDYEGQLLQEPETAQFKPKKTAKLSLVDKLDLQSKLNLASSNHSGELLMYDTHGSLPGVPMPPKGFQTQDYVAQESQSKRHSPRKPIPLPKQPQKKHSTIYSSREGGSQRKETGSSKLTYRGSLGKSKGSKGNEDISHFLRKSAQKRGDSSKPIQVTQGDQESVQKSKDAKELKIAHHTALRQNLKSQAASEENHSQQTDPKYKLDPNTSHQNDQDNTLAQDSITYPPDQASNHNSSINYTFINYQEQSADVKQSQSKKTQVRQQPYVLEKNSPYQTVFPSPQGLTTVSQNHKHLFATAQRADKIYMQQASSLDQKRRHKEFYNKRFSNIDQMVAIMTKGLKKRISPKEDGSLTPEGEAQTKDTIKRQTQGSIPVSNAQQYKDRSSSGSAKQSGSIERVSYQDKSFYFQKSTRHPGSIAPVQQKKGTFGSKDSSYFGQKPLQLQTQRGGRPEHLKMNATQKFGDKKNTTQIFSSTVHIASGIRRDQKTQEAHTPFNQHPFTPPYQGYRQQVDSGEDVSMSAIQTPFNVTSNQNGPGMNQTTNNFNPMLMEEEKQGMAVTANGGFQFRHSPLQLQLNNQTAIEDSVISASQSQGSNEESYMNNAMHRMNRLEDKINANDSINIDTLNAKKTKLPRLKGTQTNQIEQKMIESNDKDTRQLLRTLNMQEKLLQNLQLKEQLQYQRLITQNTQHKNFNFAHSAGMGQSKRAAQLLSPTVDFKEIRQGLKASLRSKERVVVPQQSPNRKKRHFGSIPASATRLESGVDGNQSVAMKDLFRKKGDTKYSRSVKANPKLDPSVQQKEFNTGHFSNYKMSLMTDRQKTSDVMKIPTASLMQPESQEYEFKHAHSISGATEQINLSTNQDFNKMMLQMNTSTYRAKFNPNYTQDSFGPNAQVANSRFKKAQSSKLKAPKGILRQLSNQRGDNVGFATAYNFKDHLAQDSNISVNSGKTGREPYSINQQMTLKKTMNLIGDYFSESSKNYQKYPNLISE